MDFRDAAGHSCGPRPAQLLVHNLRNRPEGPTPFASEIAQSTSPVGNLPYATSWKRGSVSRCGSEGEVQ
jgi:hypothetical protein